MLKSLRILAVIIFTALAVTLFACGGDDDDDGGDETAAATTTGESADETPEATEEDDDDGDGGGDLDSYFSELEAILIAADEEQEAIGTMLGNVSSEDPDYVTTVQDALQESGTLFEESIQDIGDLEPPEEAEDAHDDYLAGLSDALQNLSELNDELEHASTATEVDDAIAEYNPALTEQNSQNEELCLDLQAIADENDVDVDLECTT